MVREILLRKGFWAWDRLRGGGVRRHLARLEEDFYDPPKAEAELRSRVDSLVAHAEKTTAFYRDRKGQGFHELPVVDKPTIKRRVQEFTSTAYDGRALEWVSTSGSSGTPFQVPCTQGKQARRLAEVIYFGGWAGYRVGMRYAYLSALRQGLFTRLLQNRLQPDLQGTDPGSLERLAVRLSRAGVRAVIGYPSFISLLARTLVSGTRLSAGLPLDAVITMGEGISPVQRRLCRKAFHSNPLQRYSMNEIGMVAHECPEAGKLHVNVSGVLTEILDSHGQPVETPGHLGRLVVSDPDSHALPLIRYDTGDLGTWGKECPCGHPSRVLDRVEGRRIEEVSTPEGGRVSPFLINNVFRDMDAVVQYQFAQVDEESYEVRLVTENGFAGEDLLRGRLQRVLGPMARLRFRYESAIPPLPSGKRPYIVDERPRDRVTGAMGES